MLITFPYDEETTACVAWGKITIGRTDKSGYAIKRYERQGGEVYSFLMCTKNVRVGHSGTDNDWKRDLARVAVFSYDNNQQSRQMADVIKLLRQGEGVVVFGKYEEEEYIDKNGKKAKGKNIRADMVIPISWVYALLLSLFSQVIANQTPKVTRKIKDADVPKTKTEIPKVAHINTLDDEGWRDFE